MTNNIIPPNKNESFIVPDWPCPSGVKAITTTRLGGLSQAPFNTFNLALHVGDDPDFVLRNRDLLKLKLDLHHEPGWLEQVHGTSVITLPVENVPKGDASYTQQKDVPCVVMTADCLPVLMTNKDGTEVAAAHAGWRGLANGVLEQTLACFSSSVDEIMVWLGPAIGPTAFEVGDEVRDIFVANHTESSDAFSPGEKGKWYADIYQLATIRLRRFGVSAIYGGEYCTYSNEKLFFSYRRDVRTGRMASLIWLT